MSEPWEAVAHRGQLTMTVLTKARAVQDGIPMRAEAALVGVLHPDEGADVAVGFVSVDSLQGFIREMAPRSIKVECAPSEESTDLQSLLVGGVGGALH